MIFDFAELAREKRAKLLLSTVVPRPIAWVTTLDGAGRVNAAPFSFFNLLSTEPPVVGLGIAARAGADKDTASNIRAGGEFTVNLVSTGLAPAMNVTALDFAAGIEELRHAGLETAPSQRVRSPRIAQAPVALECRVMTLLDQSGGSLIVLGEVLALHIAREHLLDAERCHVDTPALDLVGRLHGGGWYTRSMAGAFEMPRLPASAMEAVPEGR
ncbi:flavin reductase family protein [Roseomonas sp. M0104]|uniref:Flavin reductase family protein n=1 Tax=Teichococcus coralli TaxID=2545983 RepID=A0A845BGJ7_9PROT|nr:flavin reductase family protein [Pseudoroseomonas coralli]MXP65210.1 flavin reductase family protein [Pseudoroseomonas coralli]